MSFSLQQIRSDFPVLAREVNGQPLAYLDSAASAQKPTAVIEAEAEFYRHGYAAVPYPERGRDPAYGSCAHPRRAVH